MMGTLFSSETMKNESYVLNILNDKSRVVGIITNPSMSFRSEHGMSDIVGVPVGVPAGRPAEFPAARGGFDETKVLYR